MANNKSEEKGITFLEQHGEFTDGACCVLMALLNFGKINAPVTVVDELRMYEKYRAKAVPWILPSGVASALSAFPDLEVTINISYEMLNNYSNPDNGEVIRDDIYQELISEEESVYVENKLSVRRDLAWYGFDVEPGTLYITLKKEYCQEVHFGKDCYRDEWPDPHWVMFYKWEEKDTGETVYSYYDPKTGKTDTTEDDPFEAFRPALGSVVVSVRKKSGYMEPTSVDPDLELKKDILRLLKESDGRASIEYLSKVYHTSDTDRLSHIMDRFVKKGIVTEGTFGIKEAYISTRNDDLNMMDHDWLVFDKSNYRLTESIEKEAGVCNRNTHRFTTTPDYELLYMIHNNWHEDRFRKVCERIGDINELILLPGRSKLTTYLMEALKWAPPYITRCLLENGADPTFLDERIPEYTPLYYIIHEGSWRLESKEEAENLLEKAWLLMEAGGDLELIIPALKKSVYGYAFDVWKDLFKEDKTER